MNAWGIVALVILGAIAVVIAMIVIEEARVMGTLTDMVDEKDM